MYLSQYLPRRGGRNAEAGGLTQGDENAVVEVCSQTEATCDTANATSDNSRIPAMEWAGHICACLRQAQKARHSTNPGIRSKKSPLRRLSGMAEPHFLLLPELEN